MLFLDGEEVLVRIMMGEDHRLTAEGTDLRASDVEDIAVAGEIGQGDVVTLCHQTIAEAGTVDIEGNLITPADLIDVIQSSLLKSPELTGLWEKKLRDIEHGTYKDKQFLDELIKQIYSIIDDVKKDSSEKKVSEGERSSKTRPSKGSFCYSLPSI